MSLICVKCNEKIVQSPSPDHLGACNKCMVSGISTVQAYEIEVSARDFTAKIVAKAEAIRKQGAKSGGPGPKN